jgi:hypothetical protein
MARRAASSRTRSPARLKDDVEDIGDAKRCGSTSRQCNVQDSVLLGSYEEEYYGELEPGTNVNTTLSTLQKLAKLVNSPGEGAGWDKQGGASGGGLPRTRAASLRRRGVARPPRQKGI